MYVHRPCTFSPLTAFALSSSPSLLLPPQEGYWVGLKGDDKLIYSTTVPGFLNCTRQGALPGCEIRYDSLDEQCAPGREGEAKVVMCEGVMSEGVMCEAVMCEVVMCT